MRCVAIYEFEGDEAGGELSFPVGVEMDVVSTDVGGGWWEGILDGRRGVFPASYVQVSISS